MLRTNFVGIILKKDEKILLLKSRNNTKDNNGKRWLPWWQLKKNENYYSCIIRNVKEELKIKIDPQLCINPLVLYSIDKKEQTIFLWRYLLCEQWSNTPINNEPDKCSKISWFNKDSLPETIDPYIEKVIKAFDEGEHYVEIELMNNE